MNKYCERCYLRDAKPCMECSTCNHGHRNFRLAPHTPTHADRIRAMSDEELAVTLMRPNEMGMAEIPCDHSDDKNCCECLLNWLKQEAGEE